MMIVSKEDLTQILQDAVKLNEGKVFQDRLLTPEMAADLLGVNVTKLKNRLPIQKHYLGKEVRYKLSVVNKFISEGIPSESWSLRTDGQK